MFGEYVNRHLRERRYSQDRYRQGPYNNHVGIAQRETWHLSIAPDHGHPHDLRPFGHNQANYPQPRGGGVRSIE